MRKTEPSVVVQADPLIGHVIGQYVIRSLLGDGGMAKVFVAEHQTIGRKMAVKVLKEHVAAEQEWGDRFIAEAKVIAALKHRNVVEVFDFGQLPDGRQYLMMEFISGQTLAEYLAEYGPVTPTVALDFADQLLNALGEAHKKGIVHRDLKPGNVMLVREHNDEWLLKVLDFGLARQGAVPFELPAGVSDAKTSLLAGTPAYVSPEQALGEVVDGRSDLYSLGVLLFETLTGKLPFVASDDRSLVQMHLSTRAPRVDRFVMNCPEGLSELIDALLSKERANRPASADEARQAVQRVQKELRKQASAIRSISAPVPVPVPLAAAPTIRLERPMEPKRKRWPWALVAAVVGVALLWLFAAPRGEKVGERGDEVASAVPVVAVDASVPVAVSPKPEPEPQPSPEPDPEPVVLAPLATVQPKHPGPKRLTARVQVENPEQCQFDADFKNWARRMRDELRQLEPDVKDAPKVKAASQELENALAEQDCRRVNSAIATLSDLVNP